MNLTRGSSRTTLVRTEDGFSLIELLVVVVTLGLLATIVIFAMAGFRDDAHESVCPAEYRNLNTAVESYFTQNNATVIPAADASPDGFELTLVDARLLSQVSDWYDLNATGAFVQVASSPCTV